MSHLARAHATTTRRGLGVLAAVGAAVALAAPAAAAPLATAAGPSGPCTDPAGITVVVDKTDLGGEVELGCAPEAATGTEALQAAGFTDTRDAANLVCAIDSLPDPCPTEFTGSYWSYWTAEPGGDWEMAMVGPDEAQPVAGGVEGWRYFDGSAGPTVDAPAAPSEEAADQAATSGEAEGGDAQDGAEDGAEDGATAAATETDPAASSGPSPAVLGAVGVIVVLVAAAVVVARRRASAHGPAGQD